MQYTGWVQDTRYVLFKIDSINCLIIVNHLYFQSQFRFENESSTNLPDVQKKVKYIKSCDQVVTAFLIIIKFALFT